MKKTLLFVAAFLLFMGKTNAQFMEFDSQIDPQQGDIAVGDINNDGKPDLIFSGRAQGVLKGGIMINNGNGIFSLQNEPNPITPGHFACIKFGDIDGDGDLDVIFNGNGGTINDQDVEIKNGIALNDGNGVFTLAPADRYPIADATVSCGFADLNNDGRLDYFMAGNGMGNITLFYQQEDGSFSADNGSFAATHFVDPEVTVVDFNNDGYLDLFVNAWDEVGKSRFSGTFANDGFGNFALYPQPNIIRKGYGSASWGDIDGDGWMDLLLNGDGGADGEMSDNVFRLYRNENGTFVAKATFSDYRQISVGGGSCFVDWDNDGDMDLILGGWSGTKGRQATMLFECTDAKSFTFVENELSNTALPGVSENTYEVADLNGDGRADLLIMGYNGGQENQVGKYDKNVCGVFTNTTGLAMELLSAPVGLSATVEGKGKEGMVTLSWNGVTKAQTYNLAVKNKTTGKWFYHPMAVTDGNNNGTRKVTGAGNVYTNKQWELYTLPDGIYEWTVQGINGSYVGGRFAEIKTFTVGDLISVEKNLLDEVDVYAASGKLIVTNRELQPIASIKVYALNGQLIGEAKQVNQYELALDKGVYVIEIESTSDLLKKKVAL